jgi:hypothetical protein
VQPSNTQVACLSLDERLLVPACKELKLCTPTAGAA